MSSITDIMKSLAMRGVVSLTALFAFCPLSAQETCTELPDPLSAAEYLRPDSSAVAPLDSIASIAAESDSTAHRKGFFDKVIDYFKNSNKEPEPGHFDITFLGGPSYSSSTSFELAAIAAGIYRTGPKETTPLSELDVFAEGSVTGFYNVGIRGHHSFPADKYRINYHGNFCHFPSKFWGVGYKMARDKANETEYTLLQSLIRAEFLWHLPYDIFLGPSVSFNYSKATHVENPAVWGNEDLEQIAYGVGFILSMDTRDVPHNATSGISLKLHQRYYPKASGSRKGFSITSLTFSWYKRMWRSGVVALQFNGCGATRYTPWAMLPTLDESRGMRGYYEGRYRDMGEIDITAEVRQHIWGRNGMVVWGGVGSVFSKFSNISMKRLLPSWGIGYRWEFKKNVNVRVDVGFGKNSREFSLGLNEAF